MIVIIQALAGWLNRFDGVIARWAYKPFREFDPGVAAVPYWPAPDVEPSPLQRLRSVAPSGAGLRTCPSCRALAQFGVDTTGFHQGDTPC